MCVNTVIFVLTHRKPAETSHIRSCPPSSVGRVTGVAIFKIVRLAPPWCFYTLYHPPGHAKHVPGRLFNYLKLLSYFRGVWGECIESACTLIDYWATTSQDVVRPLGTLLRSGVCRGQGRRRPTVWSCPVFAARLVHRFHHCESARCSCGVLVLSRVLWGWDTRG